MNIWIDILHTPQYNFYRNFILRLSKEGHTVFITVLDRGKTPAILKKELSNLPNLHLDVIGKHALNKKSAILEANFKRIFLLFNWIRTKHIDMAFSNGYICAFICKCKHIPNYAFGDDPQTFDYRPKIWFTNMSHYCLYEPPKGLKLSSKVSIIKSLKEWAYLIPSIFKPNETVLNKYKVLPHKYMFVREVSVGTVNYVGQAADSILQIANLIPKDMPVLLSLEKKNKRELYPKNWILLDEPLEDIHSLIYYSCGLISSGDSMAREAALLGVPAYYLGIRYNMPANAVASKVANLQNQKTIPIETWITNIVNQQQDKFIYQEKMRQSINEKFIDVNEYIYGLLEQN